MIQKIERELFLLTLICCLASLSENKACTIFRMKAKDCNITICRLMEFGAKIDLTK